MAAIYQINCGGGAESPFATDQYFGAGTAFSTSTGIDVTGVVDPAPEGVYQTERYGGDFSYTFPSLTVGSSYLVRLHFAELFHTSTGQRVFDVQVQGTTVLNDFDIVAAAGSNFKAIVREFTATADGSGNIVVRGIAVVDNAKFNGIEILTAVSDVTVGPDTITFSDDIQWDLYLPADALVINDSVTAVKVGGETLLVVFPRGPVTRAFLD